MSKSPDTIDSLLGALKNSAEAESKEIRDTVDYISSWLTSLFNSSVPSSEFSKRVSQKLRYSLRPLYTAAPASSFQLSAAVFAKIISDKIIHAAQNQKMKVRYAWEPIAESIISGVLDHLDDKNNGENRHNTIYYF
ncbi:hypothetical protein HETIRDRAFT_414736 [Heterobasidion irregulare TC 32-1]|uniref:Uncharacterized protein n=1 Tax=Heterobasidion irregulare (strain TC 32-1) TaxID=747525 RepID=W4KIT0_HETIT|nr:uncharacterized protein HETIRDRAFT_414736 [Heterobasidion irregulare TC 32-1]ETW85752.1 hypothetical protein HETIRDRAFT_414736 [Heterobasidion irregulare TC 32-1]